jgi:hypothetical protein
MPPGGLSPRDGDAPLEHIAFEPGLLQLSSRRAGAAGYLLRGQGRQHRRPGRRHRVRQNHPDPIVGALPTARSGGHSHQRSGYSGLGSQRPASPHGRGHAGPFPVFGIHPRQHRPATTPPVPEAIRKIMADANCLEIVERLPQGLDTPLAEGGASLSSGERQLLSIARAFARRPTSSSWTRPPPISIQKPKTASRKPSSGSPPAEPPSWWPTACPPCNRPTTSWSCTTVKLSRPAITTI